MNIETKHITINGRQLPVQFCAATMIHYERIVGKPFSGERFEMQTSRVVLIMAANLTADEDSQLTIDELAYQTPWQELRDAFDIVLQLLTDFFVIPDIIKKVEEEKADKQEGEKKN
jgi:hypothetical protein